MAHSGQTVRDAGRSALRDFGRAAGGALIFSLPMLMTMEMWQLGFALDRLRLFVLLALALPLLVLLSRHIGFERTRGLRDDLLDTGIAIGVSAIVCVTVLTIFGALGPGMPVDEIVGKVALQIVPASIGALLARSQFNAGNDDEGDDGGERDETYAGELFLMAVGALFLGFNVAPTEEMILISYRMTGLHAVALIVLSLGVMHGFVFALGFAGGSEIDPDTPWWSAFMRFTLPGYVLALGISLGVLWIFGRTEGVSAEFVALAVVVLGFPSAAGAAAARLIL
jgi:putative integral membrane protein (TIGR02587 family)